MQQVINFLWISIKGYRAYYIVMLIAPLVGAMYEPVTYYAIKLMVDIIAATPHVQFKQLLQPFLLYLFADIFLSVVWRISSIAAWRSEPYVQRGILLRAFKTAMSFHYLFFQNAPSGGLVSKIKGLFDGYNELWSQLLYGVLFWLLASLITIGCILFVSGKFGLILVCWAAIYFAVNYIFAKKINLASQLQNQAKHSVIGEIADSLSNIQSVKLFSARLFEYLRLSKNITDNLVPKELRLRKLRFIIDAFNDIMAIAVISSMIIIMIHLKESNQVTVGDFVFVFGMVFNLQENLWHLMREFHKLSDRMGDLKSSLSIYEADSSEYSQDQYSKHNGIQIANLPSVEFKNICFAYNDRKQIFNNLNLKITPGEKVGIVGQTGVGKTTLINLLLKVFTPNDGAILIDNHDIQDIDCDSLRQIMAVIPQDITLFNRNLMDNIRYGLHTASDAHVMDAANQAHIHDYIMSLPNQYATMVGERGVKLSGGQRQRIAIARAILKNAPILILDEATSALDSLTEHDVQDSIERLLLHKTVIVIAHRLSTLKNMNRIIVIDDGKIVDQGAHEELLTKNGIYTKIWQAQITHS